jgi:hypothetical protein
MRIASFDIGIKNMAYCILQEQEQDSNTTHPLPYSIQDWKVLNLMEENHSENQGQTNPTCTCRKYKEKRKGQKKLSKDNREKENAESCNKSAKYFLETSTTSTSQNSFLYFCKKHAIENTKTENTESIQQEKYLLYSPKFSKSALTKLSVEDLATFFHTHFPQEYANPSCKRTKKDTIDHVLQLLQGKCLMPIVEKKKAKAGDTDLVTIGRNMATLLDNERGSFADVTHIIIENQISTIAARMKTIQGMLAQYFILRNPGTVIQFVSSMNKLKGLDKLHETTNANASEYKKHKKDGVEYCRRFLDQMSPHPASTPNEWKSLLENSKKKDDLADCFLQGIWYLHK